jgi:hypothetical protein
MECQRRALGILQPLRDVFFLEWAVPLVQVTIQ